MLRETWIVVAVLTIAGGLAVAAFFLPRQLNPCLIGGEAPHGPGVYFTDAVPYAEGTGDDWVFAISRTDETLPLKCYMVRVLRGQNDSFVTELDPANLSPGKPVLGSSVSLHLNVTDTDGDGRLTQGDSFVLGNAERGTTYYVAFLWKELGEDVGWRSVQG